MYHSQVDLNSLKTPWVIMEQLLAKLLEIKYSHTPLSPLQCAWSWWTRLGSYHEEQKIFSDQVPWRRVLCIALTVKGTRFEPTPEYLHPVDFAC